MNACVALIFLFVGCHSAERNSSHHAPGDQFVSDARLQHFIDQSPKPKSLVSVADESISDGDSESEASKIRMVAASSEFASNLPPRPTKTSHPAEQKTRWPLTLQEAIKITLSQNADLRVNWYSPQIAQRQVTILDSIYDPLFQLGGEWSRVESQVTNVVDGPGTGIASAATDYFQTPQGLGDQVRLSKRLRSGGDIKAEFSSLYTFSEPDGDFLVLNPALRSSLRFQVGHNLWRGVGEDVNMVNVRVAEHLHQNSHHRQEVEVRKNVLATADAYWKLLGAREAFESRVKGVQEAESIWKHEVEKRELGASSDPQVGEAREQLERFRVNKALAQKDVADAERLLRMQMGVALEDGQRIETISTPTTDAPMLDWEQSVTGAMNYRPELRLQRSQIQIAKMRNYEACDRRKPDLSGYAGWGLTGAAEKFDDTIKTIGDGDFASWWMGLRYEHQIGQRETCARVEQTHLALRQQIAGMEKVAREVHRELHEAFQSVENAWEVIELTRQQLRAADDVLVARQEMYELGEIRLEDNLRALSTWGIAVASERQAVARYNQALARWEHARGSILDYASVSFHAEVD